MSEESRILEEQGTVYGIVRAIIHALRRCGGSDDCARKIREDGEVAKKVARILMRIGDLEWSQNYDGLTLDEAYSLLNNLNKEVPEGEKHWRFPTVEEVLNAFEEDITTFSPTKNYWHAEERGCANCVSWYSGRVLSDASAQQYVRFVR